MTLEFASNTNLTAKEIHFFSKDAVVVNRGVNVDAVFHSHFIVFLTMSRRYMNASGACVEGYKRGEDNHRSSVVQRMRAIKTFELTSWKTAEDLVIMDMEGIHVDWYEPLGKDVNFVARLPPLRTFHQDEQLWPNSPAMSTG